jgi:hypothetical protein
MESGQRARGVETAGAGANRRQRRLWTRETKRAFASQDPLLPKEAAASITRHPPVSLGPRRLRPSAQARSETASRISWNHFSLVTTVYRLPVM